MIPQLTFRMWLKWKWSQLWRDTLRRPLCWLGWHNWQLHDDTGRVEYDNYCPTCGTIRGRLDYGEGFREEAQP